jgi:hypothetical protein
VVPRPAAAAGFAIEARNSNPLVGPELQGIGYVFADMMIADVRRCRTTLQPPARPDAQRPLTGNERTWAPGSAKNPRSAGRAGEVVDVLISYQQEEVRLAFGHIL